MQGIFSFAKLSASVACSVEFLNRKRKLEVNVVVPGVRSIYFGGDILNRPALEMPEQELEETGNNLF